MRMRALNFADAATRQIAGSPWIRVARTADVQTASQEARPALNRKPSPTVKSNASCQPRSARGLDADRSRSDRGGAWTRRAAQHSFANGRVLGMARTSGTRCSSRPARHAYFETSLQRSRRFARDQRGVDRGQQKVVFQKCVVPPFATFRTLGGAGISLAIQETVHEVTQKPERKRRFLHPSHHVHREPLTPIQSVM